MRITRLCFYIFLIAFCLFSGEPLPAQNAPVTTAATVSAVSGTIPVPVTVTNFTNIGAVSLSLDYNYSVIQFAQGIPNAQLPGFAIGDHDLGTGYHRILMGWFGQGATLPNGSTLMTLVFNYTDGNTTLAWYDNGASCEYADGNYNVLNDIPQSAYYIDGYVCAMLGNPGNISGDNLLCEGETSMAYGIAPLANATGYIWSVPPGATISAGQGTNSILVDYLPGSTSGSVAVYGTNACGNGPSSQLPVTVNALPVANAGNDLVISYGTSTTLTAASGGPGTYGYHWAPESLVVNPDQQITQTLNLYSSVVFTLLVTNLSTLCATTDQVNVTITGGPLSINPVAMPDMICSGSEAQLFANAGGGSGNYAYQWTANPPGSPPWSSTEANPTVSPYISTQYLLSVSDGFNSVSGSTDLMVNALPIATVSGGDSICDDGSTAAVTIDMTGLPPWSFIYTDGVNSYTVTGQNTSPFIINTSVPGDYSVMYITDALCVGNSYGVASVNLFPVPDTPVIFLNNDELVSSACCGNQWYLDGNPISGATSQHYLPQVSGDYFTVVTLNGCSSEPSNMIHVQIIGVDDLSEEYFEISPNPAKDWILISGTGQLHGITDITIFSSMGEKVKEFHGIGFDPGLKIRIYTGDLKPGLYILQIGNGERNSKIKMLIE
jgi:hypothetical protein